MKVSSYATSGIGSEDQGRDRALVNERLELICRRPFPYDSQYRLFPQVDSCIAEREDDQLRLSMCGIATKSPSDSSCGS